MEKQRNMLDFPINELLNRIPATGKIFPKGFTQDICAGILYAFSTLEDQEQRVLLVH